MASLRERLAKAQMMGNQGAISPQEAQMAQQGIGSGVGSNLKQAVAPKQDAPKMSQWADSLSKLKVNNKANPWLAGLTSFGQAFGQQTKAQEAKDVADYTKAQELEKEAARKAALTGQLQNIAGGKFGEAAQGLAGADIESAEAYAQKQADYDKWLLEQQGKTKRAGLMSPSGQSSKFQEALDKSMGASIAKTIQEAPVNIQQSQDTVQAIDRIQGAVSKNPDIFGPTSGASRLAGALTGGRIGLSEEEQGSRAAAIQDLKQVQNSQIGRATDAGLSGINSIAEREAIIAGTKPDATPAEITAATNIMKRNEQILQEAEKSKMQGAYQTYSQFRQTGRAEPMPLTQPQQPTQKPVSSADELWDSL